MNLQGDFYHGTARDDLAFRQRRVAYFTPDLEEAKVHALGDSEHDGGTPSVLRAKLALKNPVAMGRIAMQDIHSDADEVARLQQAGFDGAYYLGDDGTPGDEIVVFDPASIQVKEAITVTVENAPANLKRYYFPGESTATAYLPAPDEGPHETDSPLVL